MLSLALPAAVVFCCSQIPLAATGVLMCPQRGDAVWAHILPVQARGPPRLAGTSVAIYAYDTCMYSYSCVYIIMIIPITGIIISVLYGHLPATQLEWLGRALSLRSVRSFAITFIT